MGDRRVLRQSLDFIHEAAAESLARVADDDLEILLGLLAKARRVFVYGTGRSGLVARAFAIRLAHLGYTTYVIGETITAPVHSNDLVVLVSGSGETYPVAMTSEIARNIGAKVAVLTAQPGSKVAEGADVVVALKPASPKESERRRLAPLGTIFETAAWLLLDAVVADLMHRRRQSEEMMRQRHATLE